MSASAALVLGVLGAALGGLVGALVGRAWRRAAVRVGLAALARRAGRVLQQGRLSAQARQGAAELVAREQALARQAEIEREAAAAQAQLARRAGELSARQIQLRAGAVELAAARQRLREREGALSGREAERGRHAQMEAEAVAEARSRLERVGGARAASLRSALAALEVERAQAEAARTSRPGEGDGLPEVGRRAGRLLGIAAGRLSTHDLTERGQSLVPLGPPSDGHPAVTPGELQALEAAAGVKLLLAEAGDAVRVEGLDGVAREVARRTLTRLLAGAVGGGGTAVARAAAEVAAELEQEVLELGQRAFARLELEPAHPEIVRLVGRLNWRTSFTQNQWKHAVEAAFLCGMMAEELNLDRGLARRAALLHDIGKALTHELDGGHAVIGADRARRLGEAELVANAIGAHHADEPCASPYAHLCAAADALSGARPGARRHSEENYLHRIADLERISREFPGVAEAFALHGGREVRVLVRDDELDDRATVDLSTAIAQAISKRLTFPGQIRVTVIRELRAVARTGA